MGDEREKKGGRRSGDGERPRGPSEYAEKEGSPPKPKTRFIFKFAAFILILLAAWVGWIVYRTKTDPRDLLDEKKRAEVLENMVGDYRKAVAVGGDFQEWAAREFQDWEKALEQKLKSPPPKTKEESAALVKETKDALKEAPPAAATNRPVDAGERPPAAAQKPAMGPALTKAVGEYENGLKAYALTDPAASQQQVQKNLRLAAGHFEACLYYLDKARAEKVEEKVIEPYEQPATKRLYDCRKRMELSMR